MLYEEIIATCCRLLEMYPGVKAKHASSHPSGRASIVLQIAEAASIARIAYHASDSVMSFEVWPASHVLPSPQSEQTGGMRSEDEWKSPELVCYQLRAVPSEEDECEPQGKLVTFCECIAAQLVALGRLDRAEADRIRSRFAANFPPENAAIEFHDSILLAVSAEILSVSFRFAAYVHHSDGEIGHDCTSGWSQNAVLTIEKGTISGTLPSLPRRLADGVVVMGDLTFESLLHVPFSVSEPVQLSLTFDDSSQAQIVGSGLRLALVGAATFVEDVN